MSFWIFAAFLITIALFYVLPPLLQRAEKREDERERANVAIYRDQMDELARDLRDGVLDREQYEQGRMELQRRLLEDIAPERGAPAESSARSGQAAAAILGAAIPVAALILYYQIGTPKALRPMQQATRPAQEREATAAAPTAPTGQPGMPTRQEIEERVKGLAARLRENPNDAQGWLMLARSYQNFERYKEASEAYGRAAELVGTDAQLWADYADALAMANGSQLQGKPVELINKALQLDPENEKALWLAGTAAFEAQNFREAVSYWERLQKLLPEGSKAAQSIAASIEEARAKSKQ